MRRLILLPVAAAMAALAWAPAAVQAASTFTVCPSGCDFSTIQAAVDASTAGDTVLVKPDYDSSGETFPIVPTGGITVAGDTAAGVLPTIVYDGASGGDALIVLGSGTTVANLRITRTSPIPVHRVVAATGTSGHLNGLTLSNVVIDFTPTAGTPTEIGFEVIGDNVTIQGSTVMGVSGNAIFVDGNGYTIADNTLVGLGLPAGHLAIGFGDDIRAGNVACAGKPHDYTIRGNAISNFADGVVWCTGAGNNLIQNNSLVDMVGRAIETAGSQGTVIQGNVIGWAAVPGEHGIGLSPNSVQACAGNVISGNTITGRPALDTPVAIVIQGCTNTQIVGNTVRNFSGRFADTPFATIGISLSQPGGLPTTTVIQGNVVQNGGTTGIGYFGSDPDATAVDHSLVLDNLVENHGANGIVFFNVRGSGSRVAGNTVRNSNMLRQPNTFGLNLQTLTGTVVEQNQAFDTKSSGGPSSGAGFFLGFTANVTGSCNTGTGNEGGLLQQFNVAPPFANPTVNCPGVTPPSLTLALDGTTFGPGDTMVLTATLAPGTLQMSLDAYFVALLEDGSMFSLTPTGVVPGIVPYARNFPAVSLTSEVFRFTLTGGEPAGTHRWLTGLTQTGTLSVVGTVDEDVFTITP